MFEVNDQVSHVESPGVVGVVVEVKDFTPRPEQKDPRIAACRQIVTAHFRNGAERVKGFEYRFVPATQQKANHDASTAGTAPGLGGAAHSTGARPEESTCPESALSTCA